MNKEKEIDKYNIVEFVYKQKQLRKKNSLNMDGFTIMCGRELWRVLLDYLNTAYFDIETVAEEDINFMGIKFKRDFRLKNYKIKEYQFNVINNL